MLKIAAFLLICLVCVAVSLPVNKMDSHKESSPHSVRRRYVGAIFGLGDRAGYRHNIRTKRSSDCERLELCRLHARSGHSLFAAYQLYFVNKENARLWDHQARSEEDCEQRYGDCYYR